MGRIFQISYKLVGIIILVSMVISISSILGYETVAQAQVNGEIRFPNWEALLEKVTKEVSTIGYPLFVSEVMKGYYDCI